MIFATTRSKAKNVGKSQNAMKTHERKIERVSIYNPKLKARQFGSECRLNNKV